MARDTINQLPNVALLEIFSKLNVRDGLLCCRVCRGWNELLLNRGGGLGSVIRICSVAFASTQDEQYKVRVGTVGGSQLQFVCDDGRSMSLLVEKLCRDGNFFETWN